MELLQQIFISPFIEMWNLPDLFVQVIWEGVVSGILYALIALGFVLIFKASGIFNFAQGIDGGVLGAVARRACTRCSEEHSGVPIGVAAFLSVVGCIGVMFLLAVTVERVVLRPLVNQPDIILFMATIGLNSFLIGFGESSLAASRRR
jgi:branched-chain amino acid transport system permease protein